MHQPESLLNSLIGGLTGTQAPQQSRSSGLGGLLEGKAGLATGAVAGGLAGVLLGGKKSKKVAKSAVKYGGAALVGGLAYKAWKNWRHNQAAVQPQHSHAPAPQPATSNAFLPSAANEKNMQAKLLLKAMVNAAKADGHVTEQELTKIDSRLRELGLTHEDQAHISQELAKPFDLEGLLADIPSPEMAAEVYVASLLVTDENSPADKGYLSMLAARLPLEPSLLNELHASAARATVNIAA